ncbi:hypothetical protein KSP39_PZI021984 [Platanthera zijinensis]|uniref:Uncharacterized protein n=1 Tax=Platanthera zijinensis TaxID=2320716 RepID=A0AAP0AX04_9ASPA
MEKKQPIGLFDPLPVPEHPWETDAVTRGMISTRIESEGLYHHAQVDFDDVVKAPPEISSRFRSGSFAKGDRSSMNDCSSK